MTRLICDGSSILVNVRSRRSSTCKPSSMGLTDNREFTYLDIWRVTMILLCKLLNTSVFQEKEFTLNGFPKKGINQDGGAMECKSHWHVRARRR